MELAIIILFSVLIGLAFRWLFLLRNTVKKHDKHLLEMEWEFNSYEKFTDKCLDRIVNTNIELDEIKKTIQATDTVVSKMNGELMKINDLGKKIKSLEDDFTDLSRDFKALNTLDSTRPYTAPPYDPMYPQITYDTNTKENEV